MDQGASASSPVLPPFRLALAQLTAAAVLGVAVAFALSWYGPFGGVAAAYADVVLGGMYLAVGLVAWWRRPANRLGPLLIFGGTAWLVGSLQNTAVPALIAAGLISATLPLSILVHLLLACPSGRLRGNASRVTAVSAYVVGVVLQVPLWAFRPAPPPFDVLLISARPRLALVGYHVQQACGAAVVATTLVVLLRRLSGYTPVQRRLLAPLFLYGVVAVLSVPLASDFLRPVIGVEHTVDVQVLTVALLPVGFVVVVLRGGFARAGELSSLVASVAASANPGQELEQAVARTLGDPSVQLLRWSAERDSYMDHAAEPVALPPTDEHRAAVQILSGDRCLGAVVYDTELTVDPAAVEAVGRVVAIALDRERLAQEASESRAALAEASSRLLTETDRERRRLARDLHDGLQVSLIRVSMQAHRLVDESGDDIGHDLATQLAADVDAAAAALRALVQGVMPAPLVERGLAAAVQELAYAMPVHAQLEVRDVPARLPAPVESTAYFVVAEALTNVVKHAGAGTVGVYLRVADDALRIEVVDDGRGGAAVDNGGTGLSGLRDRVNVLGGTLAISSDESGTRLSAMMPCA